MSNFSIIPAVDTLVKELQQTSSMPPQLITHLVRQQLPVIKKAIATAKITTRDQVYQQLAKTILTVQKQKLQPIINGTGVIMHTNLGRSCLGSDKAKQLLHVLTGYSNLELDINTGKRGGRTQYVELCLQALLQTTGAAIVNNCASALILLLQHFVNRKKFEVIVSRSELVEIGGGFRIPEIMALSGATLVEVGTTNKTHILDYERAINEQTALILKVHQSNFYISGFTAAPTIPELVALTKKYNLPIVEDIGSGAIANTTKFSSHLEPTVSNSLAMGVTAVCFSGDKLLGGPQAGCIVGDATCCQSVKKLPLYRALRCDKVIIALLEYTLESYLETAKNEELPLTNWQMMTLPATEIAQKVTLAKQQIIAAFAAVKNQNLLQNILSVVATKSTPGGGCLPQVTIDSYALVIQLPSSQATQQLMQQLLHNPTTAIIGYLHEEAIYLDWRTIFEEQEAIVITALIDYLEDFLSS